jgi:beta-phosphoglucomutase
MIAFLFDMDGTLVHSMPFHIRAWMQLLGELGMQMTPEEFLRQTSGQTNRQILQDVLRTPLSDVETEALAERKEALYRSLYRPHLQPIAGLVDFLNEARRLHLPMAVATAAGKANRDFVLEGLGIESYFSVVVGVEDVQHGKPHPEIFLKAAERLGVAPGNCLVFEDALAGIEAACRAGMRVVALATSVDAREFQRLPAVIRVVEDYTSLRPQSLLELLARP